MNVAFLMQDVGIMFGAERATVDLVTRLRKAGDDVRVLLIEEDRLRLEKSDLRDALSAADVPYKFLRTAGAFSPELVRGIRAAAAECGARIVHTIGPKATFHAYFAIRRTGRFLFSTVHGWLFRRDAKERLYEWLERNILKRFDRVIVLSSYYAGYLLSAGFRREQVVRIPSGFDAGASVSMEEARRTLAPAEPFTVGMIGRLSTEKNHEMFLRAAREVAARGFKVRFLIAGKGPEKTKLERLLDEWDLADSVRMPGYLPVEQFMRQVHMLVQCSFIENLPYSIMEAMAWCRPVLATAVGGIPDLVEEGRTGFLVPPNDHEALANRICEMSSWPRMVEEMGAAGRRKLESEFSVQRSVDQHRALYAAMGEGAS